MVAVEIVRIEDREAEIAERVFRGDIDLALDDGAPNIVQYRTLAKNNTIGITQSTRVDAPLRLPLVKLIFERPSWFQRYRAT